MKNYLWLGRYTLLAIALCALLATGSCTQHSTDSIGRGLADATFATPALAAVNVNSRSRVESALSANGQVWASGNIVGVTSQAGLSATTPVLTLYNPLGSGKDLVVWKVGWCQPVAAAAAGLVEIAINNNPAAAAVTGTETATKIFNCNVGRATTPAGKCLLAATLPAAPTAVINIGCMLTGAITVAVNDPMHWFDSGGLLRIHPGGAISVQTSTASGTNGLACQFIWSEETPTLP